MIRETRSGYLLDRLTWLLAGVGIALFHEIGAEERMFVAAGVACRLFFAAKDLMDRRRFARRPPA